MPGFAKFQGKNFMYFIQIYSVILEHNTKSYTTSLLPQSLPFCIRMIVYPGHASADDCGHSNCENAVKISNGMEGKLVKQNRSFPGELDMLLYRINNANPDETLDGIGMLSVRIYSLIDPFCSLFVHSSILIESVESQITLSTCKIINLFLCLFVIITIANMGTEEKISHKILQALCKIGILFYVSLFF